MARSMEIDRPVPPAIELLALPADQEGRKSPRPQCRAAGRPQGIEASPCCCCDAAWPGRHVCARMSFALDAVRCVTFCFRLSLLCFVYCVACEACRACSLGRRARPRVRGGQSRVTLLACYEHLLVMMLLIRLGVLEAPASLCLIEPLNGSGSTLVRDTVNLNHVRRR